MTNEEMTRQVTYWLGLQDIAGYDETALIPQLLQQGTIDLLARTRCVVRCVQLRVKADEDEYTLDHGILALVDVENGARPRLRRNQSDQYGFTLIRADLLLVKPTPSEDGTVQVWGVMRPLRMTLPTDSPGDEQFGAIPDEFQDAIVTFALWRGADYSDDASSQSGERYRTLYEGQDGRGGRLGQIRSAVNKRATAKGPPRAVYVRPTSRSGAYIG